MDSKIQIYKDREWKERKISCLQITETGTYSSDKDGKKQEHSDKDGKKNNVTKCTQTKLI